jgi:hypothetical protein
MRELQLENQLKATADKLSHWVNLLRKGGNVNNITEWMLQEAQRIDNLCPPSHSRSSHNQS